jgi:hypothetical protein
MEIWPEDWGNSHANAGSRERESELQQLAANCERRGARRDYRDRPRGAPPQLSPSW